MTWNRSGNKLLFLSLLLNIVLIGGVLYLVHALGGWNYFRYKLKNRGVSGNYENRINLFEVLPQDTAAIVFLGNSLTAYCEWAELFDNPRIKNRGIPGDYSSGVLKRLPRIIAMQPRQVFLMIGVNDLLFRSPAAILEYYEQIVAQVKKESPGTDLLLQSLLPINNQVRQTQINNNNIQLLNDGIRKITERENLTFINLYPLFLDKNGNLDAKYTDDGIHINGNAYLVWKAAIESYINQ